MANFLIIGVEGANFFNNSTKRGKERGRGGREEGGEEEGEAEILLMYYVGGMLIDILACGGPCAAARTYTRT